MEQGEKALNFSKMPHTSRKTILTKLASNSLGDLSTGIMGSW